MARRPYNPVKTLAALGGFAILVMVPYLRAHRPPQDYEFGGPTMGTTYMVKIARSRLPEHEVRTLQAGVESLLADFNRQMSTYDPDSAISRFNRHTNATPFVVPPEFARVTRFALEVAADTGGAFDPTVLPLVQLWGFGPQPGHDQRPAPDQIAAALALVGHAHLRVTDDSRLAKDLPDLTLDLNALAPGYAVDLIARYLRDHGCPDVFVDLSGEVMAYGHSAPGKPWRVAVETPTLNAPVGESTYRKVELSDRAIATSGDYRNFFEADGQIFSHVMNPHTGAPVSNGVTSASVLAPDAMTADAYATALMVMGAEDGLRWIASKTNVEAMVLVRLTNGHYTEFASAGFPR
ncbi:MAG: FAD:protein FMN transferase [Lentisphaerae bacterium]|nr:FAD:protein FMN transferase [Lentisphaerota bacterium]